MTVKEAIQKMNEKILEIRLAAAEQRPLLNDEDKEKLDELVNRSIEVVKNAGNKIEATVNEISQDEKVDEFLRRVGDRCEEACNFTIDKIRSFGVAASEAAREMQEAVEEAAKEPEAAAEPEETEAAAEEAPEEPAEKCCTEEPCCEEQPCCCEEAPEEKPEECCCKEGPEAEEPSEEPEPEELVKDTVTDLVEEPCECGTEKAEREEEPCCCEEQPCCEEGPAEEKPEECCCKEEKECCCQAEEEKAEPAEEVTREFKEEKEPSPVDLFLMSDDVQSVVKTIEDVSTNVRRGFNDYYNRPETQEDIRRAKKAILNLAEKGMAALRKALAEDDENDA